MKLAWITSETSWRKLTRKRKNKPEIIKEVNDYERLSEAHSLIHSKDPNSAVILSNTLLVDPWWKVRSQCAESLGRMVKKLRREDLPKIKESLKKGLLKDSDWRVRAQCAESMAYIFGKEAVPFLAEALNKKGMHRLGVMNALRDIGFYNSLAKHQTKLGPYLKGKIPTMEALVKEAWQYFSEHPEVEMPARYSKIFEDWGYIELP